MHGEGSGCDDRRNSPKPSISKCPDQSSFSLHRSIRVSERHSALLAGMIRAEASVDTATLVTLSCPESLISDVPVLSERESVRQGQDKKDNPRDWVRLSVRNARQPNRVEPEFKRYIG